MIEDSLKSIKAALYDRTVSPLFGTFVLTWLIWNYKFIIVILSDMSPKEKFQTIECVLYSGLLESTVHLAIGPILSTILFIFVYPYPAKWVFDFWARRKQEMMVSRQEIENKTLLTEEQSRRIRSMVIELQSEHDRYIEGKESEIARIKDDGERKDQRIIDIEEEIKNMTATKGRGVVVSPVAGEPNISKAIIKSPFRLYFNPQKGLAASKIMLFGSNGRILEGSNENENKWRVMGDKLEFIRSDGSVHSRFHYNPGAGIFVHTNDDDTKSIRSQYLIPEPDAA